MSMSAARARQHAGVSKALSIKTYVDQHGEHRATISAARNREPLFVSSESYVSLVDLLRALELAFGVVVTTDAQTFVRTDQRYDVALRLNHMVGEVPWLNE
jgi:hypothetical protein